VTEEEAIKFYKELEEHYGDKLANPDHHPKIFQYQVTLYKYYKERDE
jgi:hypothetical protein